VSGPPRGTLTAAQNGTPTYTPAAGYTGDDSFTYVGISENGTSSSANATIIVAEPPQVTRTKGFDFTGLVRKLTARVVDGRNLPYAKARPGGKLSTIRLEGDFGRPESAVTLTFYRAGPAKRGMKRTRKRGKKRTRGSAARTSLKAIARFDPFVVKRGHVVIRMKVPPLFSPTYIGVTVQEITRSKKKGSASQVPCTKVKPQKPLRFMCLGPKRGVIAPIADANRLHKRKPGRRVRGRG
jgi:hypothetical protein